MSNQLTATEAALLLKRADKQMASQRILSGEWSPKPTGNDELDLELLKEYAFAVVGRVSRNELSAEDAAEELLSVFEPYPENIQHRAFTETLSRIDMVGMRTDKTPLPFLMVGVFATAVGLTVLLSGLKERA